MATRRCSTPARTRRSAGAAASWSRSTSRPARRCGPASPLFGGATVVSDLVFTATFDGTITALRVEDGTIAWRYEASGGINAWPAVSGDTIVWAVGLGAPPQLIAFRLGEVLPPP